MLQKLIFLFLIYSFQISDCDAFSLKGLLKEDLLNIYRKRPLRIGPFQTLPVTAKKIKYELYTHKNPKNFTAVDPSNPQLNPDDPIVFIVHGYLDTDHGVVPRKLRDAFLERDSRYQVIIVNWDFYADQPLYLVAAQDAKYVGGFMAEFIFKLNHNYSIPLENILVVGHSLGGQVEGHLGKRFQQIAKKKLPRLIALDPAGPDYNGRPPTERLSPNDATFVYVIHTNGDGFGYDRPCGTIDFYPNGGRFQPGCLSVFLTNATDFEKNILCSHIRAVDLLAVDLTDSHAFRSRKCRSWRQYMTAPNKCPRIFEYMGNLNTTKTGRYYCQTGSKPPFNLDNYK